MAIEKRVVTARNALFLTAANNVSLRDEMGTVADWFEPVEVAPAANDAQGEGGAGAAAQASTAADKARAMLRERAKPPAAPAPAPAEGDGQGAAVTQAPVSPPAPTRPTAPPQARRDFDAGVFAEQMQRAADKGDADTLDALGEQLCDVLDEDLRATLTDMHERLRAGLDQPPRQQQLTARVPPTFLRRAG